MTFFWYWNYGAQRWFKTEEFVIQAPETVSRRELFKYWGFCTAVEKARER